MFCPWVRSAPKKLDATVDMAYLIGVCTDHRHGLPGRPRSSAEFPWRAARARSLSGHDVMFGYPAVETDGCTSLITLRRSRHDGLIGAPPDWMDGNTYDDAVCGSRDRAAARRPASASSYFFMRAREQGRCSSDLLT